MIRTEVRSAGGVEVDRMLRCCWIRLAGAVLASLLWASCDSGMSVGPPKPMGDDDTTPPDDDDGDDDDDDDTPDVEHVPGADDPSEWLFILDTVHDVDLAVDEDGVASLNADPYTYVSGQLTYDGEVVEDVGIRLKGKLGSFRDLTGKAAFLLDFNRYVEGRTFHGLKKLALNNMVNDGAQLHEAVTYPLYRDLGIPAPRASYAWVRLNGEDYGLYAQIEGMDDVFLEQSYSNPGGNLYEAEYLLYPDDTYTLLDFDHETYLYFELEEGQDNGHTDLLAVVDAIEASWATEAYYETVGSVLDWDHFLRFWALEAWVGQWDGYNYNSNNYMVYFDPSDSLADLLPWGHDWCFTEWAAWSSPVTLLGGGCLATETCTMAFLDELDATCSAIDPEDLMTRIDTAAELADPYIQTDPRKETPYASVLQYQDYMRAWVPARSDQLRVLFGLLEGALLVEQVDEGTVELWSDEGDLDLEGDIVSAVNHGGEDVTVGDVIFVGSNANGYPYASIVPDFDGEPATWSALETVAYSCAYQSPGLDMQVLLPVTPGIPHKLQVLFFEPYHSVQLGRKVHVIIDGQQLVTNLDTSTHASRAGVAYTVTVTPTGTTLDLQIRGSTWASDGHPIITGLVLEANP